MARRPGEAGPSLVVLDFDGTLADSFAWFCSVLNGVADRYRFRRVELTRSMRCGFRAPGRSWPISASRVGSCPSSPATCTRSPPATRPRSRCSGVPAMLAGVQEAGCRWRSCHRTAPIRSAGCSAPRMPAGSTPMPAALAVRQGAAAPGAPGAPRRSAGAGPVHRTGGAGFRGRAGPRLPVRGGGLGLHRCRRACGARPDHLFAEPAEITGLLRGPEQADTGRGFKRSPTFCGAGRALRTRGSVPEPAEG